MEIQFFFTKHGTCKHNLPIQPSWVGFHMLGWKFLNRTLGWKNPLIQLIHAPYSVFGNNGCAFDKLMLASCMMIDKNLLVWYYCDIDEVDGIRTMKIFLYEWTRVASPISKVASCLSSFASSFVQCLLSFALDSPTKIECFHFCFA